MQDADEEDLPPLEEDVDEGSRMEVRRKGLMLCSWSGLSRAGPAVVDPT